jgi:hypothetical protein
LKKKFPEKSLTKFLEHFKFFYKKKITRKIFNYSYFSAKKAEIKTVKKFNRIFPHKQKKQKQKVKSVRKQKKKKKMPRRQRDENEEEVVAIDNSGNFLPGKEISDAYLARHFTAFVNLRFCHVGFLFPQDPDTATYAQRKWIGLTQPPVFYMFDAVKKEVHVRYQATQTTGDRWKSYCLAAGGKHPSFQAVFARLKVMGYIVQLKKVEYEENQQRIQDLSMACAIEEYESNYRELYAQFTKGKRTKRTILKLFQEDFDKVHSPQSLADAWVFTEKFGDVLRKFFGMKKKN